MKKLLLIIFLFILIGCSTQSNNSAIDQSLVNQVMVDTDPEGLPYWTGDTIKKTNPELVLLMDTLYRYVRNENYPAINLSEKREWMRNYQKQLGTYYDKNHLGSDTISLFDKANAVILAADTLWAIDNDYSTMGMIVNGGSEYTRREFQEFNEFEHLVSLSNSPDHIKALEEEFMAWQALKKQIEEIVVQLNNIFNYGGSIVGVNNSSASLSILNAHLNLYKQDYEILTYAPNMTLKYGVIPEGGNQLLQFSVNDLIKESFRYLDEYEQSDKKSLKSYYENLVEANKDLKKIIDRWIDARKKVIGFATDYQGRQMNLNTGEMLVRFSSIISSIQ